MKILQISAGPNPDTVRSNGYLDALPSALAGQGHDVTRLHMAAQGPWHRGMHIEHTHDPLRTITFLNSGVYAGLPPGSGQGIARPVNDIEPPAALRTEFRAILREIKPDVVHIQNLFGFPAMLVREVKSAGAATVLTLHDYFPICPTAHLVRPSGENCRLRRDELKCSECCAGSQSYLLFRVNEALDRKINAWEPGSPAWRTLARTRNGLLHSNKLLRRAMASDSPYLMRFDAMRRMLQELDVVHCISRMQADRLQEATGPLHNVQVLPLTPPSVMKCIPISRQGPQSRLQTFCVLNVLTGRAHKGWDYLHSVLAKLESERSDFRVSWYADGRDTNCLSFRGRYTKDQLDQIAAESDFCIVPSVGLETLGFTGVEMLARGVPLICSDRCGVSEWIQAGTGIVFSPAQPENLVQILSALLDQPQQAIAMRAKLAETVGEIPEFSHHVRQLAALLEAAQGPGSPAGT